MKPERAGLAAWAGTLLASAAVVLAMAVAGTTAAAQTATPAAGTSALTKKQKKAKRKALRRCRKQRKAAKRKACVRKVKRKYRKLARRNHRPKPPSGRTYTVDVEDDYFMPDVLALKVNDWIDWTWRNSTVREGHNVNLAAPFPRGVIAGDFQSPGVVTGPGGRFRRQFVKPGIYNLYCNLHVGMTMTVNVRK